MVLHAEFPQLFIHPNKNIENQVFSYKDHHDGALSKLLVAPCTYASTYHFQPTDPNLAGRRANFKRFTNYTNALDDNERQLSESKPLSNTSCRNKISGNNTSKKIPSSTATDYQRSMGQTSDVGSGKKYPNLSRLSQAIEKQVRSFR